MSEPMVLRFQRMALDNQSSTPDLLRTAKAIAVKLQLADVAKWIDYELDGYPEDITLPDYRITKGKLMGLNPINGPIPMSVSNAQQENMLRTVHIKAPLTELARAYNDPEATMIFSFPTEYSYKLQQNKPEFLRFPLIQQIGQSKMLNVVEKVRNRLLDWSLELEQQGILGENLQFSQQDKDKAPMTVNNFNFNGNINNTGVIGADNHDFAQQNILQVSAGDFDVLKSKLQALGFSADDVHDLKNLLDSEPAQDKPTRVMPKVYAWLGKAGERIIDAGLDKAAPLAIEAITKYLGG